MQQPWIKDPVILKGDTITLLPFKQEHWNELQQAASDPKIWEFYPMDCSTPDRFNSIYRIALQHKEKGTQYPFVIINNATQKIIGSTRLLDIVPEDRKLEIGWTWLAPEYWKTHVNFECKLLLLTYCFETLEAIRVQLKTDVVNIRSRKAIEKTGATFEGILRNDRIRDNGTFRSTAYYSILADEWNAVKPKIKTQLDEKSKQTK